MSRCYCCNNILSKIELARKFSVSGEFTEMCTKCLATIDVAYDEPELEDEEYDEEDRE